jgi:ABC transporter substrate binding protein
MKRRAFITLLGGAAATWPLAARAQRTGKLPTIGFFGPNTASAWRPWTAAFVERVTNNIECVRATFEPLKGRRDVLRSPKFNHPGGNATGVNYFISELVAKRMGVLHELVPTAARFGVLINPNEPSSESFRKEVITAASTIGVHPDFVEATDAKEIEAAFTTFVHNRDDALIVLPDTLFANQRVQIVTGTPCHSWDLCRARVRGSWWPD